MKITNKNCVRCNSLEEFLHLVLNSEIASKVNIEHLFFRGESKYHNYVVPSLYLDEDLTKNSSEYYYRMLLSRLGCSDYVCGSELFRKMSEFQHYGAKTRILDITSNPLIALYFAVEKYYGEKCWCKNETELSEDGYVYIFGSHHKFDKYDRSGEQFDDGHTVAIKTALNLIPQEWINSYLSICESIKSKAIDEWDILKGMHIHSLTNTDNGLSEVTNSVILKNLNKLYKFMDLLNQRAKTSEKLVYPFVIYEDLLLSQIIIPSKCTDRIKQQQGAFIFPKYVNTDGKSLEAIKDEIDKSISTLTTDIINENKEKIRFIQIPSNKKLEIKRELSKIGITEGFVYPEIEHLSNSMLKGF